MKIYRTLTPVKEVIEELGFTITYPFDDLLFIDTNAFVAQYVDDYNFDIHFNIDLQEDVMLDLEKSLVEKGNLKKLTFTTKGKFTFTQNPKNNEEVDVKFFPLN